MTQPGKFGAGRRRTGHRPLRRRARHRDYAGERPWPFLGGTIKRVLIDVSGESFIDLAQEAQQAFARQ